MTIKQLESKAEIVIGLFSSAAAGALYDALQNGMPHDWPTAKRMLLSAGFAGVVAVFGWIKMRSPFQPAGTTPPSQGNAKAPGN